MAIGLLTNILSRWQNYACVLSTCTASTMVYIVILNHLSVNLEIICLQEQWLCPGDLTQHI